MVINSKICIFVFMGNILVAFYFLMDVKFQHFNYYSEIVRSKNRIDAAFPITFYYEAFIDHRYSPARIRIFSMNPCVSADKFLMAKISFSNTTVSERITLFGEPTEGECPWHWAKDCFYSSFIFHGEVGSRNIEKVQILLGTREISFKVRIVSNKKINGLTICVQPVYWYSLFYNIILFIEAWRAQGATAFIVYYHSATKDTRKVLNYYEKLGILTIKPWPKFGEPTNSGFPSFDESIYRVAHTLAQNLCILEMKTIFGAISDFDEVITVNKNERLIEYLSNEMNGTNVGALSFPHLLIKFSPKIESLDFSGVSNPVFLTKSGPSKIIFNVRDVDVLLTHSVRSFIGEKIEKMSDGALLHYRYNSYSQVADEIQTQFELFPNTSSVHIQKMKHNVFEIFGNNTPSISSEIGHELVKCISKLKKDRKCRSTVIYCKDKMASLCEWDFVENTTEIVFVK